MFSSVTSFQTQIYRYSNLCGEGAKYFALTYVTIIDASLYQNILNIYTYTL
jgi:hypothetical protein